MVSVPRPAAEVPHEVGARMDGCRDQVWVTAPGDERGRFAEGNLSVETTRPKMGLGVAMGRCRWNAGERRAAEWRAGGGGEEVRPLQKEQWAQRPRRGRPQGVGTRESHS